MQNQIRALKVKIKSLAAEARIIRLEERRALCDGRPKAVRDKFRDEKLHASLRQHRTQDVRQEQRSAMLAYAYLRGKPYKSIEPRCGTGPNAGRVRDLIRKFGGRPGVQSVCELDWVVKWLAGVAAEPRFASAG